MRKDAALVFIMCSAVLTTLMSVFLAYIEVIFLVSCAGIKSGGTTEYQFLPL